MYVYIHNLIRIGSRICPLDAEVAASSWTQCDTAEPTDINTADHTCSVGFALASPSLVPSKR